MRQSTNLTETSQGPIEKHKPWRSVKHRLWISEHYCIACGNGQHGIKGISVSQACHVRIGTDGGMGVKPGDQFTVPLCQTCHYFQHAHGERRFWVWARRDPIITAAFYSRESPYWNENDGHEIG